MAAVKPLLSGIRVLDMTRVLAGPFATQIFGDMGADVIKVENPKLGDDTRNWGPPFLGNKESTYFVSINRNKRSLAVDFKQKTGSEIIQKLAAKSDVLIENFIPGKLTPLGLGYDTLKKINPRLVYCSITGFGEDGPYKQRGGYDVIAASIGGFNHITGPENGDPCRAGVAVTDIATGLYAHGAILAALLQREKTGVGSKIDCNLLSTQVAIMSHIASSYLNCGTEPKRWGTGHGSIVPYQSFRTKDGRYLTVGAGNNQQFKLLCDAMKLFHLKSDNRFIDNEKRVFNRADLIKILSESFAKKTNSDWLRIFEGMPFPYGTINDMEQVFDDPQVVHSGIVQEISPTEGGTRIRVPGPPVTYSKHDYLHSMPPLLGQHTREILQQMAGYTTSEIDQMILDKIIKA